MEIRRLAPADAAEFQALRLRGLLDDPDAFGSTHAEERDRPLEAIAARLGDPSYGFVLGASLEAGGALVGVAGCYRESSRKRRHVAIIWGMFVTSEARGRGIGGALLDATLAAAAAEWPGVEQVTLTVVPEKAAARALYASRGFRSYGVAPRAMRDDERHYDMEHMWRPMARSPHVDSHLSP